jgi:hypothetical protein
MSLAHDTVAQKDTDLQLLNGVHVYNNSDVCVLLGPCLF